MSENNNMMARDNLRVIGAREHNLKNITVEIPRDKFVVITGLSGSGKSSLAFDTIFAEGQRRYVESLSAYARQFLGQMNKPDVDSIEGLSPQYPLTKKALPITRVRRLARSQKSMTICGCSMPASASPTAQFADEWFRNNPPRRSWKISKRCPKTAACRSFPPGSGTQRHLSGCLRGNP